MRLLSATLPLVLMVATVALAEEHPPATPTRDVDITYQTPTAAPADPKQDHATPPPFRQRMRWLQAQSRMRVDPSAGGIYMLTDYGAHTLAIINPSAREVLDMPAPAGTSLAPGGTEGVVYTRLGEDSVAGLPCTNWRMVSARSDALLACMTADGVMLRLSNGSRVVVEAVSVAYVTQDPAQFVVPPGYRHLSRPAT